MASHSRLQDLDKRYLAILDEGGPRKPNVLSALAPSPKAYQASINRLKHLRLVEHRKEGAGGLVARTEKPWQPPG